MHKHNLTHSISRRGFIVSAFAAGAMPRVWGEAAPEGLKLRVGLVSDVHITHVSNGNWLEKALRLFDAAKVDAVAITGDLALSGTVKEISATAQIWKRVFPNDRRSDGGEVTKLIVTGNHDVMNFPAYSVKSREQLLKEGFYCRREETWKDLFGEDYKPLNVKTVRGYDFILRHWPLQGDPLPLEEALAARPGAKKALPFFYLEHAPLEGTVNATWLTRGKRWDVGGDRQSEKIIKALSPHPNCLVLTGHSHVPLNEEESIWQGPFTAVNCGCLRGNLFTAPGRENGIGGDDMRRNPPFEMECFEKRNFIQMMMMDVFEDKIVFHRRDLNHNETLADDWVVPLFEGGATVPPQGEAKYDIAQRAKASQPPAFSPKAKVRIEYVEKGFRRKSEGYRGLDLDSPHPQLKVLFPPVRVMDGSPSRSFDFSVRCRSRIGDVERIVEERRVYSPNAYFSEAREVEECWCNFPVANLPTTEELSFEVTPYNVYGKPGRPIASAYMKLNKIVKRK